MTDAMAKAEKASRKPSFADKFVAAVVLIVMLTIPATIYSAFVLTCLWNWFAPPFTAIHLNLPEAWGLMLLLGELRGHTSRMRKQDDPYEHSGLYKMGVFMTGTTIALALGLIARLWLVGHV